MCVCACAYEGRAHGRGSQPCLPWLPKAHLKDDGAWGAAKPSPPHAHLPPTPPSETMTAHVHFGGTSTYVQPCSPCFLRLPDATYFLPFLLPTATPPLAPKAQGEKREVTQEPSPQAPRQAPGPATRLCPHTLDTPKFTSFNRSRPPLDTVISNQ